MKLSKFVEKMPTQITEEIEQFCAEVAPGQKPVYVPVKPEKGAVVSQCHNNVEYHVKAHGGTPIFGWIIWQSQALLHAEFHCNWLNPAGELSDITPKDDGESQILFLPDQTVQWVGRSIPSHRKARRSNPELSRFVAICKQADKLMGKYRTGQPMSSLDAYCYRMLLSDLARMASKINESWTVNPDQQAQASVDRRAKNKAERQRRKQQRRRK